MVKTASRLMPRTVFTEDSSRASLFAAHQDAIKNVPHPLPSNPSLLPLVAFS